jgi:hypothetical protein
MLVNIMEIILQLSYLLIFNKILNSQQFVLNGFNQNLNKLKINILYINILLKIIAIQVQMWNYQNNIEN